MKPYLLALLLLAVAAPAMAQKSEPLVIGETFVIQSRILHELRRINVYAPAAFIDTSKIPLPVMYMPDGGIAEDFLHVAGLVQVGASNATMRPFLLVGIENTQRRRDLTGPTQNAQDKKIAAQVGGSEAFRRFLREELMPAIKSRYRTSGETAIVGESLAGLFVVETLLLEPDLFDTYIAFDPSLWWNDGKMVGGAVDILRSRLRSSKRLYIASSSENEIAQHTRQLADNLRTAGLRDLALQYHPMANEQHATIYHPAALIAFRALFAPPPKK